MENSIRIGDPDGYELDTCIYDKRTILKNVTIEILENSKTGKTTIGWYRQYDTEEINEIGECL